MQPYPQAFHPNQSDVHLPLPKTLWLLKIYLIPV
jgi:hypothetical protein